MRAALYLRRSEMGDEDKNSSIETQRKETTELALQNGDTLVEEYCDPGGRSMTLNRPVLNRLMLDAKQGKFDILYIWKWDRFSRGGSDEGEYAVIQLKMYGVQIKSVHEPVEDNDIGTILRQLYFFTAKQQHKSIVLNIRKGQRARVDANKLSQRCHALYGYMFADEKHERYLPNPATAPIVQRMWRMGLEGVPLIRICNILDQEGIPVPTKRGTRGTWRASGVSKIFNNPAYMGHMWKNRMENYVVTLPDPATGGYKDVLRNRPRKADDPLLGQYPPETCPPLVSEEDWYALQERLERNRQESSRRMRHPEASLLRRGFAKCGYCGRAMACAWTNTENLYRYRCCAGGTGITCEGRYFSWHCDELDQYVWDWTVRALSNPQLLKEKYERWKQIKGQETIGERDQLKAARIALHEAEERYEAYASEIGTTQNATVRATLIKNMEDADAEREAHLVRIANLEETLADTEDRATALDNFVNAAARWSDNLETLDFDSKRRVLRAFGIRAVVRSKRDASPVQMEWALGEMDDLPFEFPTTGCRPG